MRSNTHVSFNRDCHINRALQADQEFFGAIGCFGLIFSKPLREPVCWAAIAQIAFRSLVIRKGSGTADVMSVVLVAAEVTGDQVALEGYHRRHDESQFG